MNIRNIFLLQLFALSILLPESAISADFESEFNTTVGEQKRTFKIILSKEDFDHVMIGRQTEHSFSGGHDWPSYYEAHIKNDRNTKAYFDTNLNCFIVDSEKGDSLVDIIFKLKNTNLRPKYHTLFPAGVLTPDFIMSALKKSIYSHYAGNDISRVRHNIDDNTSLFYAENGEFKVAGYFERTGDVFKIKTCFPDLSWYYRIDFKHRAEEHIQLSRFLRLYHHKSDPKKNVWEHNGVPEKLTARDCLSKYAPEPRVASSRTKENQAIDLDDFILHEQIVNHLQQSFLATDRKNIDDTLGFFFFEDEKNPTTDEIKMLYRFVRLCFPDFKINAKKSDSNIRKLNLIKLRIAKLADDKEAVFNLFGMKSNSEFGVIREVNIKSALPGSTTITMLQNALYAHTVKEIGKQPFIDDDMTQFIEKIYERFLTWLLESDDLRNKCRRQNIIFEISYVNVTGAIEAGTFSIRLLHSNYSIENYLANNLCFRNLINIDFTPKGLTCKDTLSVLY